MNEVESMNASEQESQEDNAVIHTHHTHEEKPETLESPEPHETHEAKGQSQFFLAFTQELEKEPDADLKLQKTIEFMEAALAQSGSPHFKSFWDARTICLQLFKENIQPAVRAVQWAKYSELSKEARRLKDILDEQSAFAAEQIGIAIEALEKDLASFAEHLEKMPLVEFPFKCQSLESKSVTYQGMQRELNLLNAQASRINALRKELIRTEMRVRQKNKFFQRLSAAGDLVFPRRKDLIRDVSQQFISDIDAFINANFTKENAEQSLFFLREEIKALQGIAKALTLNTQSFTHTRAKLSECWDKIKGEEKERKKARAQQRATFKDNVDMILGKIAEFNLAMQEGQLSTADANKQLDDISTTMRDVELGRDEVKYLREELNKARKPLADKLKAEEQARHEHDRERDLQRQKKNQELRDEISTLLSDSEGYDADKIVAERDALLEKIAASPFPKSEKLELERQLKPLRDIIDEKKEQALLSLSDDDRQALQQLKDILKQRKERRQEIKDQIEVFRKAKGASGLDFEQALSYDAQLNAEKERLEKVNHGIQEIEQKITQLAKKGA